MDNDVKLFLYKSAQDISGWESAICAAEIRLAEAETLVTQLKGTLRKFKRYMANGEPWPGGQLSGRQHSNAG